MREYLVECVAFRSWRVSGKLTNTILGTAKPISLQETRYAFCFSAVEACSTCSFSNCKLGHRSFPECRAPLVRKLPFGPGTYEFQRNRLTWFLRNSRYLGLRKWMSSFVSHTFPIVGGPYPYQALSIRNMRSYSKLFWRQELDYGKFLRKCIKNNTGAPWNPSWEMMMGPKSRRGSEHFHIDM